MCDELKLFCRFLKERGIYEKYISYIKKYGYTIDKDSLFVIKFIYSKEGYAFWSNESDLWYNLMFFESDNKFSLLQFAKRNVKFRKLRFFYKILKIKSEIYIEKHIQEIFIAIVSLLALAPFIIIAIILLILFINGN